MVDCSIRIFPILSDINFLLTKHSLLPPLFGKHETTNFVIAEHLL